MGRMEKYAELFELLCERFDGADFGKKAAQKMFYFFEREGISLNLRYGIHYYGPYSSKLDDAMYELAMNDYITIDTTGTTHVISAGTETVSEEALTGEEQAIAEYVIDKFAHKTPLELEALSTMDYVANSILKQGATDADILEKFKEIKGSKFNQTMVDSTLKELKELDLIA